MVKISGGKCLQCSDVPCELQNSCSETFLFAMQLMDGSGMFVSELFRLPPYLVWKVPAIHSTTCVSSFDDT